MVPCWYPYSFKLIKISTVTALIHWFSNGAQTTADVWPAADVSSSKWNEKTPSCLLPPAELKIIAMTIGITAVHQWRQGKSALVAKVPGCVRVGGCGCLTSELSSPSAVFPLHSPTTTIICILSFYKYGSKTFLWVIHTCVLVLAPTDGWHTTLLLKSVCVCLIRRQDALWNLQKAARSFAAREHKSTGFNEEGKIWNIVFNLI